MIYLGYLLTAAAVVILSIKASQYIDLLDKHTRLSGAFLGGVMLSAVTSFPELFTSISAVLLFERPAFSMGNILGSDLNRPPKVRPEYLTDGRPVFSWQNIVLNLRNL